MYYIQSEQINPVDLPGNVFGYNHMKKNQICRFALLPAFASKLNPDAPTFEINGHEASVWYQDDELRIVWTNSLIKPIW